MAPRSNKLGPVGKISPIVTEEPAAAARTAVPQTECHYTSDNVYFPELRSGSATRRHTDYPSDDKAER